MRPGNFLLSGHHENLRYLRHPWQSQSSHRLPEGRGPKVKECIDALLTRFCNIWMIDTGAGYIDGRLTIMDVEIKQFWQEA